MYQIELLRDMTGQNNTMIYDQSRMNELSLIGPTCDMELNEAGNLKFTLLPDHPLYNELEPLASYLRVLDDSEEIFYGRVLHRGKPMMTGQVTFQCEGALSFLLDSEVTPYGKDANGNQVTRKLTAEAFFQWCIAQHNADVNDPRRTFTIGVITAAQRTTEETYSISSYTQTKSCIQSNILDVYGGFLRVRPGAPGGGHYIDWVENYQDSVNAQQVIIGTNVESQTNELDGSSLFTVLRPIGKDGLKLSPETYDLYPQETMNKYGRIIKSIQWSSAETAEQLLAKTQDYISRINKTLFASSDIQYVDMRYIDGTSPKIRLGSRFTQIRGLEGMEMVVSSISLNFESPQSDTLDLKNRKSLDPDLATDRNSHSSKYSANSSKNSKKAQSQYFKYLQEIDDMLEVTANHVNMHGETLEAHYQKITMTAGYYERLSSRVDQEEDIILDQKKKINDIEYNIRTLEGTDVIQNSQFISTIAGKFEVWEDSTTGTVMVHLKDGAEMVVDDENGGQITVGQQIGQLATTYNGVKAVTDSLTGSALWTQQDHITEICGEYDIVYQTVPDDEHPGQYKVVKQLVVNSGGGMTVRKDGVEYGLYASPNSAYIEFTPANDADPNAQGLYEKNGSNYSRTQDHHVVAGKQYYRRDPNVNAVLTGGVMVDEINRQTVTKILGSKVDISASDIRLRAEQSLESVVGHWEEKWIWDVDDQGNRVKRTYLEYTADAGMIVKRLDEDGIQTEYGVWDQGNLTGGVMAQQINGQNVVHIKGSKVFVGDGAENVEENLSSWSADTDENYSLVTSRIAAEKARIDTIVADYVTTQNIKSRVGDIDQVLVKRISGSTLTSDAYFDTFQGHHYEVSISGGGNQTFTRDLIDGIYALQIVPPSGNSNTYTLQKKTIMDNGWSDVGTFSRATDLGGAWGSGANCGKLTVTATPQGDTYEINFPSTEPADLTGAAAASMTISTPSDVGDKIYVLSNYDDNHVDLRTIGYKNGSSTAVTVARIAHNKFNAGQDAAGVIGVWTDNVFKATKSNNTPTKEVTCEVTIYPTSVSDLNPGQSVTIYARGNSSNKQSVTVKARALNLQGKVVSASTTGDKTVWADSGYDGLQYVTINRAATNQLDDVVLVKTDGNRYNSYYTCKLYDSSGNVLKTIPGSNGGGLLLPMASGTFTSNTSYNADNDIGNFGSSIVGYRSFTINVSSSSSGGCSHTSLGSGWTCTKVNAGDEWGYTLSKTVQKDKTQPNLTNGDTYTLYK